MVDLGRLLEVGAAVADGGARAEMLDSVAGGGWRRLPVAGRLELERAAEGDAAGVIGGLGLRRLGEMTGRALGVERRLGAVVAGLGDGEGGVVGLACRAGGLVLRARRGGGLAEAEAALRAGSELGDVVAGMVRRGEVEERVAELAVVGWVLGPVLRAGMAGRGTGERAGGVVDEGSREAAGAWASVVDVVLTVREALEAAGAGFDRSYVGVIEELDGAIDAWMDALVSRVEREESVAGASVDVSSARAAPAEEETAGVAASAVRGRRGRKPRTAGRAAREGVLAA